MLCYAYCVYCVCVCGGAPACRALPSPEFSPCIVALSSAVSSVVFIVLVHLVLALFFLHCVCSATHTHTHTHTHIYIYIHKGAARKPATGRYSNWVVGVLPVHRCLGLCGAISYSFWLVLLFPALNAFGGIWLRCPMRILQNPL